MNLPNPLLKFFKTEQELYIYSAHTNRIFRITEAMADILENFGRKSKNEIIERLKEKHSPTSLEKSYKTINELHKTYGYFSPGILKSRVNRLTEEQVKKEFSSGINHLSLVVTENCNFRCKYCIYSGNYTNYRTHSSKRMTWSEPLPKFWTER